MGERFHCAGRPALAMMTSLKPIKRASRHQGLNHSTPRYIHSKEARAQARAATIPTTILVMGLDRSAAVMLRSGSRANTAILIKEMD